MKISFRLLFFLSLIIVILCIYYYTESMSSISIQIYFNSFNQKDINNNISYKYTLNRNFMINNNLAQYSSYLIVDQDENLKRSIYRIESIIQLNYKYINYFGEKENFTCVLKLLPCAERTEDVYVELDAFDSPKFYWDNNKKLIYNLDLKILQKAFVGCSDEMILKNMVVAIIWKYDFNKTIEMNNLLILKETSVTLPYSLIKYQIPTIIESGIPRLKTVSLCLHYTYAIPPNLENWLNLHLSFGINEIMMYDSVNENLKKYVKALYGVDNRLSLNAFNIDFNDLCNETILFEQYQNMNITQSIKEYLLQSCFSIYDTVFQHKIYVRHVFEQLTSNDCFTVLKEKHEFIAYYDLDEFVFPRNIENVVDFNSTDNLYSCNNFNLICSKKPFQNNFNSLNSDGNYFYNYLQYLIEKNKNGRDVNKLGSIGFGHALYLIPNNFEKQLIYDLGLIVENIESNKNLSIFPLSILLSSGINKNGHTFTIQKEDIDFIKYLYKAYNSLIPCIYKNYLKNISSYNGDFIRHLYYITEGNERIGKSIHYFKNVKSLFIHYAQDSVEDHWSFDSNELDGHFLPHFRKDTFEVINKNFNGSIRNLNIDFEYVIFLLKNYTSFCEI